MSSDVAIAGTRADLLAAARRLFAERGFYGASIASIAEELGLTKQALIHHFGAKERLYGEVLSQMAGRLSGVLKAARTERTDPLGQLEALLVAICENALDHPTDTQILMRELLDNRARAEHAHSWPMKDFLDGLTALAKAAPGGAALSETEALARVYLAIGAFNYLAISEPTLTQMYGKEGFAALKRQAPGEVRRMVRALFG